MTPLYPDGVYAPLPRFSKKTQTNNAPRAKRSTASARRSLGAAAVSFAPLSTCPPQCTWFLERAPRPRHYSSAARVPGAPPRVGRERVEPDRSQPGAHLQEDVESGMKQEGTAPATGPGEPRACEHHGQLLLGGSEHRPADV